jgi:hypothetical protein
MSDPGALAPGLQLAAALVAVLVLPGWLALELAGRTDRGFDRLAVAVGCSIVLWPLVLLWTSLLGFHWTAAAYRAALAVVALAVVLVVVRRRSLSWPPRRPDAAGLALGAILVVALLSRAGQARGLVATPWVDGYHHTLITQLVLDAGGVPGGFQPYLPVDRFYYHFGFHALAAAVSWLSGASSRAAVLWLGQALSASAVLAAYYLARRLTDGRLAALAAASVPAGLFWFPAYYLSWGRFTQLAGLVALPAAWALVWDAARGPTAARRTGAALALAAAASAGLVLVHYRVTVYFALGVALLAVAALVHRGRRRRVLGALVAVTVGALILALPWLGRNVIVGANTLRAASATWLAAPPEVDAVPAWLFTIGANGFWLRLAGLGLVAGMARRRPAAWLVAVYLCLVLVASSPGLFGLSASWVLPRFAAAIAAWLPVAVGLAFLADALVAVAVRWRTRRARGDLGLAAAAVVLAGADAWLLRGTLPLDTLARDVVALSAAGVALAWSGRSGAAGLPDRLEPVARPVQALVAAGIVGLTIIGAWSMRGLLNESLVLLTAADLRAADWVRANTAPDARFLVRAADWQLGTYRGQDGGYWLPLTAGRATTMPAVFYNYGAKAYGLEVADVARQVARGDGLTDGELLALMARTGAEYVYLGPTGNGREATLSAARLDRVAGLERVYAADGVYIARRRAHP